MNECNSHETHSRQHICGDELVTIISQRESTGDRLHYQRVFLLQVFLHFSSLLVRASKPNTVSTNTVTINFSLFIKVFPQQAEVAHGVPGRLRPRIFLTFGTTRAVGRQSYAPAAFTLGEILGTHFQGLSRPQGTWFRREEPRIKFLVTPPGIVPGTVRLVAQCLNHYATPGPLYLL